MSSLHDSMLSLIASKCPKPGAMLCSNKRVLQYFMADTPALVDYLVEFVLRESVFAAFDHQLFRRALDPASRLQVLQKCRHFEPDTLVQVCSRFGELLTPDVTEYLVVGQGCQVDATTEDGWTALMCACRHKKVALVNALIGLGADVNKQRVTPQRTKSTLMLALMHGAGKDIIGLLLRAGADPNSPVHDYRSNDSYDDEEDYPDDDPVPPGFARRFRQNAKTTLMHAWRYDAGLEVVQMLLAAGANVNGAGGWDGEHINELMYAIRRGVCVEVLRREYINAGASVNFQGDAFEPSCLSYAVQHGSAESIQLLLAAGADCDAGIVSDAVMCKRDASIVRMLIEAGADLSVEMDDASPLSCAIEHHSTPEIVRLLLEAGANAGESFEEGQTLLSYAVEQHASPEVVRLLLEAGADPNASDSDGRAALTYAIDNSAAPEVVRLLLEAGADPDVTFEQGQTLLSYAREKDASPEVVDLLLEYSSSTQNP